MTGWTLLIALQLMPLPPVLWNSLPGREVHAAFFTAIGLDNVWRPLTLAPNATRNALFAAFVPLSVLVSLARVEQRQMRPIMWAITLVMFLSAILAIIQIVSQAQWAYLFRITSEGAAVGLFANRNHQAMLLVTAFPILGLLAAWPKSDARHRKLGQFLAMALAVLLVPLIMITGSRAGLVLLAFGALGGWMIFRSGHSPLADMRKFIGPKGAYRWPAIFLVVGFVAMILATIGLSRAEAIQRLFSEDVSQEIRVRLFPTILQIGHVFAPWGSGFGSFDPVFRMYEPFDNLTPLYVNHAHNDLLEIYIEGGIPALVLVGIFMVWVAIRSLAAWRPSKSDVGLELLLPRCGSVITLILLAASLADYPLRTPSLAGVLALAVAMLAQGSAARRKF